MFSMHYACGNSSRFSCLGAPRACLLVGLRQHQVLGLSAQRLGSNRYHFQSASSVSTSVPWSYRGLGRMALLGHLDRWSCVLKSLPQVQVRPHPWKECPQTIHEELPPGPSLAAGHLHTPKPQGHWCTAAWRRGPPGAFRISRLARYALPHQYSLRPSWCNCGTLEQFVPASVLSKRVPCEGRECFSLK
jgi:hypothetical protein